MKTEPTKGNWFVKAEHGDFYDKESECDFQCSLIINKGSFG